jgi:nicotinate dehydrogenase subunit A
MVKLTLNGVETTVDAPNDAPLLYVLRNDLSLNGAKFGCGVAQCGACTVLLDGEAVRSCVIPLGSAAGASIMTVEGLLENGNPGPLQRAFIEEQAAQCGYCIPGMVMSAKALLDQTPKPSEADVRSALDGNLCRCGSHNRIVRAVLRASQEA